MPDTPTSAASKAAEEIFELLSEHDGEMYQMMIYDGHILSLKEKVVPRITAIIEQHWREEQEYICEGCINPECSENQPDDSHDY